MRYEAKLAELAGSDERLVVMTAENRAPIRGLPAVLGERFVDTGITEQTLIGMAAGLALRGRIPVVHALASFLTMRPFEFIRTDVGIAGLPVKLVGYVPGFLSEANGPTHQALEDVALMRGIPGMKVVCPSDEEELVSALPLLLGDPGPVYIRFNARPASVAHSDFALGRAEVLREGTDVALLVYGTLVAEAVETARLLSETGLSVRLVNMRTLAPADGEVLLESVFRARLVVTLEDHFATGGLASILAETLLAHGVTVRHLPFSLGRRWFRPALFRDVLSVEGFRPEQLAERIHAEWKGISR